MFRGADGGRGLATVTAGERDVALSPMPSAGRTVPVELVSVPRAVIGSVWKGEINI